MQQTCADWKRQETLRVNIILVVIDTLRYDHLNVHGVRGGNRTPATDRLAPRRPEVLAGFRERRPAGARRPGRAWGREMEGGGAI